MDKKKMLIIGGSAAGTALVALVAGSIILSNRPSALILRATANTISDARKIEAFSVAEDVANGGSIAVSANLDSIANDDLYAQAKIYCDADNLKSAYEMTLKEDDDVVLNSRIVCNQDKIVMTCPELFDGSYGVTYKNLQKNLPGSIFDPDEETDYSLTDEQFEYFMNLNDTVKQDKNLEDDLSRMELKYRQLLVKTMIKYAEVGKGSKTITVAGEKLSCTVITLSLDEDSLPLVFQDIIDYANNDKDLEKFVNRLANNGAYADDPEEFVDDFYNGLEDFEDSLEELKDTDIDIQLDCYITKSGRRLARLDAEFEVEDESMEMSLVLGKNVSTTKEMSLTATMKGSTKETYSIVYSVEEDSTSAYEAEFEIKHTRERSTYTNNDKANIKIEWDRRAGDFELKCKDEDGEAFVIKGNLLQKGDKYIFLLTNIRSGGTAVPYVKSLDLTITIDKKDPIPKAPGRYTEITTMNERDFKHFTEDIEDGIEKIKEEYFDR